MIILKRLHFTLNKQKNYTKILLQVKYGKDPNPGIRYQFALPEKDKNYVPQYSWQFLDWDLCSDACGGGQQVHKYIYIIPMYYIYILHIPYLFEYSAHNFTHMII